MNAVQLLLSVARVVLRRWKLLFGSSLVAGILMGALTILSPRDWTVPFAFVAEHEKEGGSSLASELGFGGGNSESPEFYVDLLKTDEVLLPMMSKKYALSGSRDSVTLETLLEIKGGSAEMRTARTLKALHARIISTASRRSGIVSVRVRLPDPLVAKTAADDLLAAINLVNSRVRQTRGRNDRVFSEQRLNVIRAELRQAEAALRSFLERNRFLASSPSLQVERLQLEREITVRAATLESVSMAFEAARRDEVKDTPRISVIERPRVPAIGQPRNTLRKVLLTMLFTGAIFLVLAFLAEQRANGSIRTLLRQEPRRLRQLLMRPESSSSIRGTSARSPA